MGLICATLTIASLIVGRSLNTPHGILPEGRNSDLRTLYSMRLIVNVCFASSLEHTQVATDPEPGVIVTIKA